YPTRRVIALGFVLIGAGFSSNLLPRTLPLLVLTTCLFTFGEMISMPVAGAYVADLAPVERRGLYMGIYGMVWAAAFVFGPSLGLALFSLSRTLLWITCGVLGILAAMLISRRVEPMASAGAPQAAKPKKLELTPGGASR